ncbi:MAG: permease-like cell division protein FtsX [Dictyoglomaceae bacterium]|nr:permease-like cell division protein FtsX [Dictyoglomaceae bacterium]
MFIGLFVFFLIFLILIVFITSLNGSLSIWQDRIKIYAFFPSNISNENIVEIQKNIELQFPIMNISFIDQGTAWQRLKESLGSEKEIFAWISPNNLPKALEISLFSLDRMEDLVSWLMSNPNVEDVKYSLELKNQWVNINRIANNLKKLFIFIGSLAYVIIIIELLAHSQIAFPSFSIISQVFENFFTIFFSSLSSLIFLYYLIYFLKDNLSDILPYISIMDIKHFILWGLFFFLSSLILSFSSAFIGWHRLRG